MNIINHDLKFGRERARDLGIGTMFLTFAMSTRRRSSPNLACCCR